MHPYQQKETEKEKLKALRAYKAMQEKVLSRLKQLQRTDYPYSVVESKAAELMRKRPRSRRKSGPNNLDTVKIPVPVTPIIPLPTYMGKNQKNGPNSGTSTKMEKRQYARDILTPNSRMSKKVEQRPFTRDNENETPAPTALTREWKNIELPVGMRTKNISTEANASRSPDSSITTLASLALATDVTSGFLDQFSTNKYWQDGTYQKSLNTNFNYERRMEGNYTHGLLAKNKKLVRPWQQPKKTAEDFQYKHVKFRLNIARPGSRMRLPFGPDENHNDIIQEDNNSTNATDTEPTVSYAVPNALRNDNAIDQKQRIIVKASSPVSTQTSVVTGTKLDETMTIPPPKTTIKATDQENIPTQVTEPQNYSTISRNPRLIRLTQKIGRIRYGLAPTEALPKPVPKADINGNEEENVPENVRPTSPSNSSKNLELHKVCPDEIQNVRSHPPPEILALALIPLPWHEHEEKEAKHKSKNNCKAKIQKSKHIRSKPNAAAKNLKTTDPPDTDVTTLNSNSEDSHRNGRKKNYQEKLTLKENLMSEIDKILSQTNFNPNGINTSSHTRKILPVKVKVSQRADKYLTQTQRKPAMISEIGVRPKLSYIF